jgi:hypothetical protein
MNTQPFTDKLALAELKGLVRDEIGRFTVTPTGEAFLSDLLQAGLITAIPLQIVTKVAVITRFMGAGEHEPK